MEDSQEFRQKAQNLYETTSALIAALEAACGWTGTDWIGSRTRTAIDDSKKALAELHGAGRNNQ